MGILDSIRRTFGLSTPAVLASPWAADPSHLESVTLAHLYDLEAQTPITRARAMRVGTVSKARRIIASNIGRLPLVVVDTNGHPVPEQPALVTQPERGLSRSTSLTWLADSLMFYPFAWWLITDRDYRGYPKSVVWVPWEHAVHNDAGQLAEAFGEPVAPADGIRFDSPDEGLLINAADDIRRAIRLNASAARAEDNPVPVVDLHNTGEDLTDVEIDQLIERWRAARQKHGIGYSSRSLEVKPLASPTENLMVDGRKAIILEIARHAGVPAWSIDAPIEGTSLTYSNITSRNRELIDTALSPYMTAIADRLTMPDVTPRGMTVRFSTDALTTPAAAERYDAYEVAIRSGVLTANEARERENMPALTAPEAPSDEDS